MTTHIPLARRPRHLAEPVLSITRRPIAAPVVFFLVAAGGVAVVAMIGHRRFAAYGAVLGVLLTAKMVLSVIPDRPLRPATGRLSAALLVPLYNEDPAVFRALLASLDRQERRPDAVVIVDDASADLGAYRAALEWAASRPEVTVLRHPRNLGKRHAIATAVASTNADVWITVDSDTVLEPGAIAAGLAPFADPRVQGVTGTVLALNATDGLLPALVDVRYTNAFLGERAAHSRLGAVLCACGSLAFWRTPVILDNLHDFLHQQYLGARAEFGDDRRLTRYALDRGRVVLARDAIARTAVPQRIGHYVRQQVRWGKSFWRESSLMLATGSPRTLPWWLTLVEIGTWAGFSAGLFWALGHAVFAGSPKTLAGYLGWVFISSWARSGHVFTVRGRGAPARTFAAFAVSPLYGLLSLLLLPLRLYSLATLKASGWGTRQAGPETSITHVAALHMGRL